MQGFAVLTPEERPTARELQQRGNGDPWQCPRCGCKEWRVIDTKNTGGDVTRTRVCRFCGKNGPRIYTEEKPYRTTE